MVAAIPRVAVSPAWQRFLAFDVGTRRTGVAVGNRISGTATPCRTIVAQGAAVWSEVAQAVGEWQPDALVVGVPLHPDGAAHDMTALAQRFARRLEGRFGLPVLQVDERYSTTEARAMGATDPDAGAACIVLEQLLRDLP